MKDRISTYPGRVRLVPVAGQENVYDIERADEPSQVGTELKRDTLLSNATAALFGLNESNGTPDAAFAKTVGMINEVYGKIGHSVYSTYVGNGKTGIGNKNTLTFDFEPKILFIEGHAIPRGTNDIYTNGGNCYFTWNGNTVSWYATATTAWTQFNNDGETYYYVAMGWDE